DRFLKAVDWGLRLPPQNRPQSIREWRKELLQGGGAPIPMAKTRVLSGRTRVLEDKSPTPFDPPRAPSIPRFALDRRSATVAAIGGPCLMVLLGLGLDQFVPGLRLNPVTAIRLAFFGGSASGATCGTSAPRWREGAGQNG